MKNTKTSTAKAATRGGTKKAPRPDAVALLKADHRKVEDLFEQYEAASRDSSKAKLARQICLELVVHTTLEEEIFYPACRAQNVEHDDLDEAQVEHDGAKVLIREVMSQSPSDDYFDAKVKVLSEYIKHHVGEEEMPKSGIFTKAKKAGVDMMAVGAHLAARKAELMAEPPADAPPHFISLQREGDEPHAAELVKMSPVHGDNSHASKQS
ncbi:MAG: hemerythrin domain-containing protein [Rhizomicrobium sp.]|nr:hemerythrin domain-containing protein [Rhizomicrobium sp.]